MAAPTAQNITDLTTALNHLETALRRNNNLIPRRNPAPSGGGPGGSGSTVDYQAREKRLKTVIRRLEALQTRSYSKVHAQNIKNAQIELKAIEESVAARKRENRIAEHRMTSEDIAHQKRLKNEERFGHVVEGIQDGLHRFFGRPSVIEGVDGFIKDFSSMLGAGVEWSFKQYVDSAKLGIKQQDLIKLQQQYSHLYVSMGQANNRGIDFADAVKRGSDQLDAYTSSNEESANLAVSNLDLARSFGLSIKDSATFADNLNKQFAVMNTHIKVTAEEFKNLTSKLQEEGDVKDWMLRLSESEREAHIASSIALYEHFRTLGKTNESAQNLTMRFNDMFVKKKAKDYLKETVKMQAAMGAMGMGDQAGEYFKLREQVFFGKGTEQEQKANKKRLADMMGGIGKKASELYGSGQFAWGSAAVIDKLDEHTEGQISGFRGFSGELQKTNGFLEQILQHIKDMDLKGVVTTTLAEGYKTLSAISTWFHDSPGELLGGIVTGILTMLGLKTLLQSIPKVGPALSGIASTLWNITKVAGPYALMATSVWMVYENHEDMVGGLKLLVQDLSSYVLSKFVGIKDTIINGLGSLQDKYNDTVNSWIKSWEAFSFSDTISSMMSPFNTLEDYFKNSTFVTFFDSFIDTLFSFDDKIADWFNNTSIGKIVKETFNIPNTSEVVKSSGFQNESILQFSQPQIASKETITKTIQKEEAKDEKIAKANNEGNMLSQELIKLLAEQNKMNQQSLAFQKQIAETNEKMSKPDNMWFQRYSYDNNA